MANAFRCDFCNNYCPNKPEDVIDRDTKGFGGRHYDLCRECAGKLDDFIKKLRTKE